MVIHQLREIVDSIHRGQPFLESNPRRLKMMGLALLVGQVGMLMKSYWFDKFLAAHVRLGDYIVRADYDYNGSVVWTAIACLLLAKVFEAGATLQEEQRLTV